MTEITARTIRFPKLLNERLEDFCADNDRPISWAVNRAVEHYLEAQTPPDPDIVEPYGDDGPSTVWLTGGTDDSGRFNRRLIVEDFAVPYITVTELAPGEPGGHDDVPSYVLSLDGRFGTVALTKSELFKQAWFWSHAMAISAGYSCHGPNSRPLNRHGMSPEPQTSDEMHGERVEHV